MPISCRKAGWEVLADIDADVAGAPGDCSPQLLPVVQPSGGIDVIAAHPETQNYHESR